MTKDLLSLAFSPRATVQDPEHGSRFLYVTGRGRFEPVSVKLETEKLSITLVCGGGQAF
jgi:hypothetical protein